MAYAKDMEETRVPLTAQKHAKLKHAKLKTETIETDSRPEPVTILGIRVENSQPASENTCLSEEQETSENLVVLEQDQVPQQNVIVAVPTQELETGETKAVSASSSDCQYGFGYLSQREKGEGIPDSCVECAKSLSCMLSEYYKTEEPVKEIKKWYSL